MKTLILFSIFILQIGAVTAQARPEVSIPEVVEISQRPLLRLGDLAQVSGGSMELLAQLDNIILREDARELALQDTMNSSEILGKFREALKKNPLLRDMRVSFKVPTSVKIHFSKTPISREEVQRKVSNVLRGRCRDCEFKVSVQSTPAPQKDWELDLSQLSSKGSFLIPVIEAGQKQNKWISGAIRVSQLTPVATRLILQGERVQPEDVRMAMTDTTFAKDATLRMEDIQGQIAVRAISIGNPIWSTDLKKEPAAKRGQVVKAILGDGDFEIVTNMQAEENGFVGDLIKVKNLENQKVLSGMIVEKGVVKLQ